MPHKAIKDEALNTRHKRRVKQIKKIVKAGEADLKRSKNRRKK